MFWLACWPQSNSRSTSSDGVPPKLEILGVRRLPRAPVWPVRYTDLTGRRREAAGVDRFDDLVARSSAFECVTRFCVNTFFGNFAGERLIWLFKTDLIYSLEKMGVITDLDEGNISTSIEELSEEEC